MKKGRNLSEAGPKSQKLLRPAINVHYINA